MVAKLYHISPSASRTTGHKSCILVYYQEFDAFWCENHDDWVESKCGDLDCEFCKHRPDEIEVKKNESRRSRNR